MAFVSRFARFSFSKNANLRTNLDLKYILPVRNNINGINSLRVRLLHTTGRLCNNKPKVQVKEFKRLLGIASPEKYRLTAGISLLFISSGITMSVPFAVGKVIDIIFNSNQDVMLQNLKHISLILVGIFAFGAACNFGRTYLMHISSQRITQSIRRKVYSAIVKQDIAFFDKTKTGELINRLSADSLLVSECLTNNIADGLRNTAFCSAGLGMMFLMSPKLALVGLSIVPPVALLGAGYGRVVKKISRSVQDSLAQATDVAEERIANIRTVRAFGQEEREFQRYSDKIEEIMRVIQKEALARATFYSLTGFCGYSIILAVLYSGGLMVTESALTPGQLTAFVLYAVYVAISFNGISSAYSDVMKGLGASTRLWELIDLPPSIPIAGGKKLAVDQFRGDIIFQDTTFAYPTRSDVTIFDHLNLQIPAGSITAVVGSSGSGKSTLAALLLRFYDPKEGRVLLDGHPITDLDPQWLRDNIGTVSQEPSLFSCSIRDNILYGAVDPKAVTDEQIIRAATEANAWSFIRECPEGLNTIVGERGVLLSGGQRQRLAIARAIIKNPRILLLDEATSALDAESESLVQEALERIMKGRTVLVIAHRLSTIRNADQIAVLDKGRVVELGPYETLMAIPDGAFRKLVEHQAVGLE
nr:ABCB10 protein [Diaphanosoma celebensis]